MSVASVSTITAASPYGFQDALEKGADDGERDVLRTLLGRRRG